MRNALTLFICLLISFGIKAQEERHLYIHHAGTTIYENSIVNINDISFQGSPSSALINATNGQTVFPITMIDSLTFGMHSVPAGDAISIIFNGNSVQITNPYEQNGVSISYDGADVTVNSTIENVNYQLSGSSSNGSIVFNSERDFSIFLNSLNLSNNTKGVISITKEVNASITLNGASAISDGENGSQKGAIYTKGALVFADGNGILNVTGNAKHGICTDGQLSISSAKIIITDAKSDAIHVGSFSQTNGETTILAADSDGIDCAGEICILGGTMNITSSAEDVKCLKAGDGIRITNGTIDITSTGNENKVIKAANAIDITGGDITLSISGYGANGISSDTQVNIGADANITIVSDAEDGKAIKSDGSVEISGGNIDITHSGGMSKGIKGYENINITGGSTIITASGNTVIEVVNEENVPSYCSAIKCDGHIGISGGTIGITLPASNNGGKGISADGSICITGGTIDIETHGDGEVYFTSGSNKDSFTSACIKCDGNIEILSGTITCTSSGAGGKGISADGTLTIGVPEALRQDLTLNVSTSGIQFLVSGSSGGWPGGDSGDYANPKAIKSAGNLTINSGTIIVNCTQNTEGGECIESKASLTFNGGEIDVYSAKDDAINAADNIFFNGGVIHAQSDGNDAIDSNGKILVEGGLIIANGSRQPECGFDCDNNQFKITGGCLIGTGGSTSNPTASVCTQPSLKINTRSNYAIQILDASGNIIATYQCPELQGGGGPGGGPGGNGGLTMLLSNDLLETGHTYTIKYGGSLVGGESWNGLYINEPTYSGGQQTTVTINSMLTTVNAGGNGW